jgi:hypothetical protein
MRTILFDNGHIIINDQNIVEYATRVYKATQNGKVVNDNEIKEGNILQIETKGFNYRHLTHKILSIQEPKNQSNMSEAKNVAERLTDMIIDNHVRIAIMENLTEIKEGVLAKVSEDHTFKAMNEGIIKNKVLKSINRMVDKL